MNITKKGMRMEIADFHPWVAFEIACRIEKNGEKFYGDMAKKIEIGDIREMEDVVKVIEGLKNAEIRHYKIFKGFQGNITKPSDEEIQQTDIYQMINFGVFDGQYDLSAFRTLKDSIKFAIYIETKTIELFQFYQKMVKEENTKKSLEIIAQEEKQHKADLENILTSKFQEG